MDARGATLTFHGALRRSEGRERRSTVVLRLPTYAPDATRPM